MEIEFQIHMHTLLHKYESSMEILQSFDVNQRRSYRQSSVTCFRSQTLDVFAIQLSHFLEASQL